MEEEVHGTSMSLESWDRPALAMGQTVKEKHLAPP